MQGKVAAVNKCGGKLKNLSMAYSLSNKCAKNLCKRAVLVQLINKNVEHVFFGTQCIWLSVLMVIGEW